MNKPDRLSIEDLIHKFRKGKITSAELKMLLDWYNGHDDGHVEIPLVPGDHPHALKARMLNALTARIDRDRAQGAQEAARKMRRLQRRRIWTGWAGAAAVLVFAIVGYWVIHPYLDWKNEAGDRQLSDATIAPGGHKAVLIRADGREIVLRADQKGIQIGDQIRYLDGTSLAEETQIGALGRGGAIEQLILRTPRGGTYQITLPDGTDVWLNAGTTLTYPSRFDEDQRRVEIVGEAYFAVRPAYHEDGTKIPFWVSTPQQEIEVLGTEFNVAAYPDQPFSKTTLIEGRVRLNDHRQTFVLQPGDQATTVNTRASPGAPIKTTLQTVETGTFTAWRDGRFSFDGKSFVEIMNEIAHWYDLEAVYKGETPREELVGDAFRNQNLGLVLRVLDVAEIDYDIDVINRKLIIHGKNSNSKEK